MTAISAERIQADAEAASAQLFVINLCASTSPMALTHPSTPELKRYTFFVSRQREEGRERFRLHMGYFSSQDQAESLLSIVRDVYPAAWAGPAPSSGLSRRTRGAAPVAVAPAPPAPLPLAAAAAAPAPVATAPAPAVGTPVVPAPVAAVTAPAPQARTDAPVREVAAPPALEAMSNVRDVLAQLSEEAPRAAIAAAPAPAAAQSPAAAPRVASPPAAPPPAAVAAPARPVPPPAAPAAPAASPAPAAAAARATPPVARPMPPREPPTLKAPVPVAPQDLSASQTLRVLEEVAAVAPPTQSPFAGLENEPDVRVVTPEDTQTLTDIRLDAQNNAPPCFAVQLVWSVSPIDVTSLVHLAIFDAYTLYNVEGSRQGRKWYGLRLGFFSDPNSATQVAHYVRSDYPAVAVVPVAIKERDRAKGGAPEARAPAPRLGDATPPLKPEAQLTLSREGLEGFQLLDDDRPAPAKRDFDDQPAAAAPAAKPAAPRAAAPVAKPAPAAARPAPAGRATGKRVVVRKRPDAPLPRTAPGAPTPLESTLEILGASTLTLDESREIINDSAVRKPVAKKPANGRFSKLLSRLSGG